ncbi:type ISP restriction/modification enzyme [Paracoccus aestuariivivens]|uniref:site-specific DNA-methyltransferase (adenine-specific) n=1 Tax=Paracoccus aestuariivivens TaxID=1820333 RepID=A0A6L6JFR2_9RHOB|nr:type ISP restriction/modification enzyme [Paracoccus aestuariivivens]MTH79417.1 N-6 DNA methylase [Paracoccus aestuariivivens]
MKIKAFISKVQAVHKTGVATEHSYRSAFEALFADFGVTALNEPKRVKCGAPDFIVSSGELVIGHLEAKDLHVSIRGMKDANKAQQERYRAALPNLIYTNGLDWDFYRDGDLIASVTIGDLLVGVVPRPDRYEALEHLLQEFVNQRPQTITDPEDLAVRMAGKANLIKDVLRKTLVDDEVLESELMSQYQAFRENLIKDITPADFADIYAETIAYGMFAARLHDETRNTFSRQEALELLPKSNPFLRALFGYVAGHDLDDRIAWIIDDLARVFQACDISKLMKDFGSLSARRDPFIHFYETFLAAYNPAKRKARGVWYTPEPVVEFIVRAVDDVLQSEFGLADGLADVSKVKLDWDTGQTDKKGKAVTIKKEVHRVQILDPATGTGTFLAEVIKQIAPKVKGVAPGMWSSYIESDLIPRLHGFELLMASYAMCHMKLDMILTEMGYKPAKQPPRLSVYLTNSLEEGEPANQTLPFTQWLSREAKGANTIKRDMPIMCVLGNPPYSGESSNKGQWAMDLISAYKVEPGGKTKLQERNSKWINDDYVKFIRFAEHMIEKTGEGVLGFITNHGYINNPTFRGMRWRLMQSFDKLYIIDLHGNSNKKEVAPDGSNDVNVFDIKQGVAIILGVKHRTKDKLAKKTPAEVNHAEMWGPRRRKYDSLQKASLKGISWNKLDPDPRYLMFYPINRDLLEAYDSGFALTEFFPVNSVGIVTANDGLTIDMDRDALSARVKAFADMEPGDALQKYARRKNGKISEAEDWKVGWAQKDIANSLPKLDPVPIHYRPLDIRWTYFTGTSRGFHCRPRGEVMRHLVGHENLAICAPGQTKDGLGGIVVKSIAGHKTFSAYDINSVYPLYLHPEEQDLDQGRRVNFDPKLWKKMRSKASHPIHGSPDELATFDYIYGVLNCQEYLQTFEEFLRIDTPRIPWPANSDEFWDISAKGAQLRALHLLDPAAVGETPYPFMGDGDNVVDTPKLEGGRIWINATQCFDNVPSASWNAYIGGYQPGQKWLKDRKGRALTFDDVKHFQRILKVLCEAGQIAKTIKMTLTPP